jgi:hypothetical protein
MRSPRRRDGSRGRLHLDGCFATTAATAPATPATLARASRIIIVDVVAGLGIPAFARGDSLG